MTTLQSFDCSGSSRATSSDDDAIVVEALSSGQVTDQHSLEFLNFAIRAANTLTVTNLGDSGSGSLRQAIADAADGDTITFAPGVAGTITLTSGELLSARNVTVSGPGANVLAVSGNDASHVFHIGSGTAVIITGLTITGGNVLGAPAI